VPGFPQGGVQGAQADSAYAVVIGQRYAHQQISLSVRNRESKKPHARIRTGPESVKPTQFYLQKIFFFYNNVAA
jgi:hypothetical protein